MAPHEESKNKKPGEEVMCACDMYVEAALPNVWFLSLREGRRTSLWGKLITAGCQSMNRKGERLEEELSIMWRSGASRGKGLQNKEQPSMGDENPWNEGEILFRGHFPP